MSKVDFVVTAEARSDMGKGASRRLRREGKIPGVIYGAHKEAVSVLLDHNEMMNHLKHEAFYSHILTIKLGGKTEQAVLKDLQRHPAKPILLHADFQRVSASEKLRLNVPLHFVGGDVAPGVKIGGGSIAHALAEVEITCLPKNLPEFIEVDLSGMELGQTIHLSDLKVGKGVELVALTHGSDLPVAALHAPRGAAEEAAPAEGEQAAG
ncbi:MAG: 50S ribosomal protein L25/general stress protein Ctc [Gammaproteobacteria bacterium]|nr:50S ribosomal protein L25/general stress protein Ctc [Gammaproteobacteria bacterium]